MKRRIGPMKLRLPFSAADAARIGNPAVVEGALANWPDGGLRISGTWTVQPEALQLRPILPGALRFIASGPVPSLDDLVATNGHLTPASLAPLSQVTGTLVVQVQDASALKAYRGFGAIEALGEAPTFAFFGPVRLRREFWEGALLDWRNGLLPGTVGLTPHRYPPGHAEWERHAAAGFVAGLYSPILNAAEAIGDDQAARLPMPDLAVALDGSFLLDIGLGWQKSPAQSPVPTSPPDILEPVPVRQFLRQVAAKLREPVLAARGAAPVIVALMEEQDNADTWNRALRERLFTMGFGSFGGTTPLHVVLREFQIAAAGEYVAQGKPGVVDAQLAHRDFRDLVRVANTDRYGGPISGRANFRTRALIAVWEANRWRSPLILAAFARAAVEADGLPGAGIPSIIADIWERFETRDETLRIFAADFSRDDGPLEYDHKTLAFIGRYHAWPGSGGPGSQLPEYYPALAAAEATPERVVRATTQAVLDGERANDSAMKQTASTFRVVRSVAEIECAGFLDQINAYDGAGISVGLLHVSAAGTENDPAGGTELGGFSGLCQYLQASGIADADVFRPQGLAAQRGIGEAVRDTTRPVRRGAYFKPLSLLDDRDLTRLMVKGEPADTLSSWRLLYRWVRIGRANASFGPANWAMALRRLARICETAIVSDETIEDSRNPDPTRRTIANVFTSELLIAWLLRWHVKKSVGVISRPAGAKRDQASTYVVAAYKQAAATKPATNDAWERALRDGLKDALPSFQADYPHNEALTGDFATIAAPPWVPPHPNPRHYGLDPALRVCSLLANSFHRLAPSVDP